MTKCFKWIVVLFVSLSFTTSIAHANEGGANGPVINAKVIESLKAAQEVPVLIKLRAPSDDPLISRMATATDPSRYISKEDINSLQSEFEIALIRDGLQDEVFLIHQLENIPWVTGTITQKALEKLQTNPNVAMVVEDKQSIAFLSESGPLIHRDEAHDFGYTGSGISVAVLDTGIDTDHPNLIDDLVREECFLSSLEVGVGYCPSGGDRESGPGSAEDGLNHGTHVSGIITSSIIDNKGIAPDTGIVAVKVLGDNGSGWNSDIIAGIDWVTSNKASYGIRVINMSLGGGAYTGICDTSEPAFAAACDAAKSAGIAIFAASGNEVRSSQMASPACLSSVISVGAVYDINVGDVTWGSTCADPTTHADKIVCFSNVSTVLDLLAPGALITSTTIGGGEITMGGTSMASPHAAAVAALMFQKDSSLTPDQINELMKCSGDSIFDERIELSFPRVDALAAVQTTVEPVDNDEDGYTAPPCGNDCDDNDPEASPGLGEICNDGIDNDCDGLIDEDDPNCCSDADATPINTGQTVGGTISSDDCVSQVRGSAYYAESYSFDASSGEGVAISLQSSGFDTYLYLIGPNGSVVTEDDDSGEDLNSKIPAASGFYTLPSSGTYIIEATTWGKKNTGSYTLKLSGQEQCSNDIDDDGDGLVDCNDPDCCCKKSTTLEAGDTANGTLSTDDCTSQVRDDSYYADRYSFSASAGQEVAISLTSTDFGPYLSLIGPGGSTLSEIDAGTEGNNSRIPQGTGYYNIPSSGTYIIEVTSSDAESTGSYALTLNSLEYCYNGIDDDVDGLIDCDDPDCDCQCTDTNYSEGTSFIKFNPRRASKDKAFILMCINQEFCTTLKENPDDIIFRLDDCDALTIPASMLSSNKRQTKFRAKASTYKLKVDCVGGWLKLRLKKSNLDEECFTNPVKICVSIKDGPCICAEDVFAEEKNNKDELKQLTLTVTETCTP